MEKLRASAAGGFGPSRGDRRTRPPAPGFRDAGNNNGYGTLYRVGYSGYSWSSAVTGADAHFLNFNFTEVYPNDYNSRAYGLQLRCLQE
ncbi:MAG: hypothetical protein K2K83_01295 [Rikenella sp.]|nr:hypothetical protein [Rikenella sp.]